MEVRGKDDSEHFSLVYWLPPCQVTMGELAASFLLQKITGDLQPLQTPAFCGVRNHLPPLSWGLQLAASSFCHTLAIYCAFWVSPFLLDFCLFFLRLGPCSPRCPQICTVVKNDFQPPPPSECWDRRHAPPHPVHAVQRFEPKASLVLDKHSADGAAPAVPLFLLCALLLTTPPQHRALVFPF